MEPKFIDICRDIILSDKYDENIKAIIINGYINGIKNNKQRLTAIKKLAPAIGTLLIKASSQS